MKTTQSTAASNTPTDVADVASEVQSALTAADQVASQRIQNLQLVHQARNARLARELAVLKAEHAPDDEIKTAEAAVAASGFTASRVAVVHQQLTTPIPQVAAEGWALHGRVFDDSLKPLSGFTVFLVDAQKSFQKQFGFAYTDDTGYYLINYSGPDSATTAGSRPAQSKATSQPTSAAQSAGVPGTATQPSPSQPSTEPQLFLEVADTQGYPVYLSDSPFEPVAGTATYQNVTLALGKKPIGDPPQQVRDIAMPPGRKKKSSHKKKRGR